MNGRIMISIIVLTGIGVCGYFLLNKRNTDYDVPSGDKFQTPDNWQNPSLRHFSNDDIEKAKKNLYENKLDSAMSIKKRHEEAAAEMKESLNHVFDNTPIEQTENTQELNKMMDDIDKLMD